VNEVKKWLRYYWIKYFSMNAIATVFFLNMNGYLILLAHQFTAAPVSKKSGHIFS